jgi:putative salt-induced outer membrane protein
MRPFESVPARALAAAVTACGLALAGMPTASAQLVITQDDQWRYALGVGASVASGNSSSKSVNITADAVKATDWDKWTLYGRLLYGEDNEQTTSDQVSAGMRYDRDLSQRWFQFGIVDWLRDRPANIAQRWSVNTGLGYHVFKEEEAFWDLFAGLGYTQDELVEATIVADKLRSNYGRAELLLGQQSQHRLTDTTLFKQRLSIYPNLEDTSNFRAMFDTSLAVAVNKRFDLTASLGYRYNSDPGTDLGKFDLLFVTGILVKME